MKIFIEDVCGYSCSGCWSTASPTESSRSEGPRLPEGSKTVPTEFEGDDADEDEEGGQVREED